MSVKTLVPLLSHCIKVWCSLKQWFSSGESGLKSGSLDLFQCLCQSNNIILGNFLVSLIINSCVSRTLQRNTVFLYYTYLNRAKLKMIPIKKIYKSVLFGLFDTLKVGLKATPIENHCFRLLF